MSASTIATAILKSPELKAVIVELLKEHLPATGKKTAPATNAAAGAKKSYKWVNGDKHVWKQFVLIEEYTKLSAALLGPFAKHQDLVDKIRGLKTVPKTSNFNAGKGFAISLKTQLGPVKALLKKEGISYITMTRKEAEAVAAGEKKEHAAKKGKKGKKVESESEVESSESESEVESSESEDEKPKKKAPVKGKKAAPKGGKGKKAPVTKGKKAPPTKVVKKPTAPKTLVVNKWGNCVEKPENAKKSFNSDAPGRVVYAMVNRARTAVGVQEKTALSKKTYESLNPLTTVEVEELTARGFTVLSEAIVKKVANKKLKSQLESLLPGDASDSEVSESESEDEKPKKKAPVKGKKAPPAKKGKKAPVEESSEEESEVSSDDEDDAPDSEASSDESEEESE